MQTNNDIFTIHTEEELDLIKKGLEKTSNGQFNKFLLKLEKKRNGTLAFLEKIINSDPKLSIKYYSKLRDLRTNNIELFIDSIESYEKYKEIVKENLLELEENTNNSEAKLLDTLKGKLIYGTLAAGLGIIGFGIGYILMAKNDINTNTEKQKLGLERVMADSFEYGNRRIFLEGIGKPLYHTSQKPLNTNDIQRYGLEKPDSKKTTMVKKIKDKEFFYDIKTNQFFETDGNPYDEESTVDTYILKDMQNRLITKTCVNKEDEIILKKMSQYSKKSESRLKELNAYKCK